VHAALNSRTMLPLKNGLAPCSFWPVLAYPQLVTPTTMLGFEKVPAVVPVRAGLIPRLISHGPLFDPPHIREPIIVLLEFAEDT
jgi:hypothetical protein